MGNNKTTAKLKYNRENYKRYEFNIRVDSKLNAIVERYKEQPDNNLSELIKSCLCQYFCIDRADADSLYVPYRLQDGNKITNNELDKYFK